MASPHAPHTAAQIRSLFGVGACASNSAPPSAHTVTGAQARSWLYAGGRDSYFAASSQGAARMAHARSAVVVGAVLRRSCPRGRRGARRSAGRWWASGTRWRPRLSCRWWWGGTGAAPVWACTAHPGSPGRPCRGRAWPRGTAAHTPGTSSRPCTRGPTLPLVPWLRAASLPSRWRGACTHSRGSRLMLVCRV